MKISCKKIMCTAAVLALIPSFAFAKKAKKTEVPAEPAPVVEEAPAVEEPAPEPEPEPEPEPVVEVNPLAELFTMVHVEGGGFSMGSGKGDTNERPVHWVDIDSFEMSTTEITQKLYTAVMGENPSFFAAEDKPVEKVTWYKAVIFCNKLSESFGLTPCYTVNGTTDTTTWPESFTRIECNFKANGYRLPTEAEWEYAAVEGSRNSSYKYSGSDRVSEVAWYTENSTQTTHAVATKKANALGLYDMSGNVEEWCWDWFSDKYYASSDAKNPKGADIKDNPDSRSVRGGSYGSADYEYYGTTRIAERHKMWPNTKAKNIGFRIVQTSSAE